MQIISPDLIDNKKVLLRLDLDVPIRKSENRNTGKSEWVVAEDFRLQAALPTLEMCLAHAKETIIMGHLGRPEGKEVPELSVAPIHDWLLKNLECEDLDECNIKLLENLRFERGESFDTAPDKDAVLNCARELASLGEVFINDAFAAHHPAASTTVLPTLLAHAAGIRFAHEVEKLGIVRNFPKRPQVAIIGGVKVEDKYPAVVALSKLCDAVLVGGLLAREIKEKKLETPHNVFLATLSPDGLDISSESIETFRRIINHSKQIIWAGPMGKYEVPEGNKGNEELAQAIIASGAESIIGGGDTEAALEKFLDKFSFISVGGGAMLKFLSEGTLPTIEALK